MTKAKSEQMEREQRRRAVAAALLAGKRYREIAEELDVSLGTVSNDVSIIMGRWKREGTRDIDDYVELNMRRLEAALAGIWENVTLGRVGFIDRMLAIMKQMDKYHDLESPTASIVFDVSEWKATRQQRMANVEGLEE